MKCFPTQPDCYSQAIPQKIVETICRKVMDFPDCSVFFNYLLDNKKRRLRLNAWAGVSGGAAKEIEWMVFGETVSDDCAAPDGGQILFSGFTALTNSQAPASASPY